MPTDLTSPEYATLMERWILAEDFGELVRHIDRQFEHVNRRLDDMATKQGLETATAATAQKITDAKTTILADIATVQGEQVSQSDVDAVTALGAQVDDLVSSVGTAIAPPVTAPVDAPPSA